MYYNTELFGAKVRFIRTKLKLTQKEVADQAGINISTMRRIESGKVIPKLETLEYLSPILKEDLHLLFMQYRIDNYDTFYNLKTRLENKLDNVDIDSLEPDLQELAALKSASKNIYYQNTINQLIFLVSAVISHKKEDDPAGALEQLITAMRITTPAFALEDFKAFVYSEMELRVLMNIAFALNSLGNTKLHLGILNLCGEMVNAHNPLYPKILYNLAGAFMQDKDFVTALDYNEQAISWCQRNRTRVNSRKNLTEE